MHDWDPIIKTIEQAQKILIFTHANMDGDAAGSSCALCRSLRLMGKECFVLLEDECPEYLSFLNEGGYFVTEAPWKADVSIAVDCGDDSRIEHRTLYFHAAEKTLCIDHHMKTGPFAQESVIDPEAPAAGSLIFELLQEMNAPIDKQVAEAIYVAIDTDTGSFRYGNTTPQAYLDAAMLYAYGIDHVKLSNQVWDSYPLAQLKLEALAVERAVLFAEGKAALSWCTQEDLKAYGARMEHSEMCIDRIRSISGVEAAAFIREKADGSLKVSLRSKSYADVNEVARTFDGGGHLRASGCTLRGVTIEKAVEQLIPVLAKAVEQGGEQE
ncbi:MAG: bifunctional oligoribonuclease/PAP phosphatase NrnA [Firmicutes bacterium]|nr:bifunctional oligoribonuclease/PAP phosphatase NrnA [Bacillota bacterium]